MPLAGKVAVITGASSGIGEAIAKCLASAGASVVLGARRSEELERVKKCILEECHGSKVVVQCTDVTKREEVKALVATAEELGPVDIIINCAGVMYFTNMKNIHEDEWEQMVDVNIKGVLNGIGAVLDKMVARGSGHILTISSDGGRRVFPKLAVYCGTKYFVEAMSEGMRRELVGTGVKVTTIQPGDVATDLVMANTDSEAASEIGVTIGEKIGRNMTPNQVLQPEDVANTVLWALTAPAHVAINEVMVEPRDQT